MIPLTLPQLSISMEDAKVTRWLVADGEQVRVGQPVVEIETDKATMEVEAPADGTLRRVIDEGAVVAVEATLAQILAAADSDADEAPPPTEEPAIVAPAAPDVPRESPGPADRTGGHVASPAARRIANDRGIDLARVRGTGPGGRIVADDLGYADAATAGAPPAGRRAVAELRSAVVADITASWQQIPHINIGGELAADGLVETDRSAVTGSSGVAATVTDLLILAVSRALTDVPELNGGSPRVNLALAVATDDGLVAPVLKNVTDLGLAAIARERHRLVTAARGGRIEGRDLGGATCTLSNLGAYPVDYFTPVISGPQVAMVATGRVVEKPVAVEGMLAVRSRIWVNVSIDHRVADGAAGGRFLAALERRFAALPTSLERRSNR